METLLYIDDNTSYTILNHKSTKMSLQGKGPPPPPHLTSNFKELKALCGNQQSIAPSPPFNYGTHGGEQNNRFLGSGSRHERKRSHTQPERSLEFSVNQEVHRQRDVRRSADEFHSIQGGDHYNIGTTFSSQVSYGLNLDYIQS